MKVDIIRDFSYTELERAVNRRLKFLEENFYGREIIDVKFATSERYLYAMIIYKG